jgi:putative glycosyltransferase (TIGR04372 family)
MPWTPLFEFIKKQLVEIRNGGPAVFLRKFFHIPIVIMNYAHWAVPVVLVLRCLRPWRIVRFGTIRSNRIGHFAADAGQQWAERQLESNSGKYIDLYWLLATTCNDFWARMVRRNFPVHWWVRPLDVFNQKIPGGVVHHRPSSDTGSRDLEGLREKVGTNMPFLPEEDVQAKAWLRSLGWRDGEPIVCLLVRDSAYLESHVTRKKGDWRYHDYRDSDIATYVPAAEWLAGQGVWVLRMGKKMARSLPSDHPRVVDYAFRPDRSDFLDIWLFAHCDLCMSTGSGPDTVSDVYRRPLLLLNFIPVQHLVSWSSAMHCSKKLVWKSSGAPLTLREHLDHAYLLSQQYEEAGIEIIDLTSEEILAGVQERWQRIQGTWTDTEDDLRRHARVWEILAAHPDFAKFHGWIHPEARLAATWLRRAGDAFLQ